MRWFVLSPSAMENQRTNISKRILLPPIFFGMIRPILASLCVLVQMTLRIRQQPIVYSVYDNAHFFLSIPLSVFFVYFWDMKLLGYYYAHTISEFAAAVGGLAIMLSIAECTIDTKPPKEALRYSLPITYSVGAAKLTGTVDRLVLRRFASLHVLGIYAICLKFTAFISTFSGTMKLSYVPFMFKAVSEDRTKGTEQVSHMRLLYIVPVIASGLCVALLIEEFVAIVNRSEYLPIASYIPYLAIPAVIGSLNMFISSGLYISKRTDLLWIPYLVGAVITIGFGLAVIPRYQISGIVVTQILSALAYVCAMQYLADRYFPTPLFLKKVF